MIERILKSFDNKECCGLLLTDLSKAFDCVKHDLLIAKMNAFNFDNNALALVHSYRNDRKQRTNINSSYWGTYRIYLGPLLFNIYINDIFYTIKMLRFPILLMTTRHLYLTNLSVKF